MAAQSVSRTNLIFRLDDEQTIKCELKRHLSPLTVGKLLKALPIKGKARKIESCVYVETPLELGSEKSKKKFGKGDIAFLPLNGSLCFFLEDVGSTKPMNPVGRILEGIEHLENVKRGSNASIDQLEAAG